MSNEHRLQWLRKCFEPATHEKANGQYRLFLCNGHGSHCTGPFLAHSIQHKILVFVLIPHSSHLTQPLDNSIFGPLKRVLSGKVCPLFQTGISRIQKAEWLKGYYDAHRQVFSSKNIKGGFSGTGIFPYNPGKVLNRIVSVNPLPEHQVTPPSTPVPPMTTITPFSATVLTSSPSDFSMFQAANSALNALVDRSEPLSTPACSFVRCLTSTSEKLFARTSLLQEIKCKPKKAY